MLQCVHYFVVFFAAASGVFVSIMLLVLLLEGHLHSDIGNLPVVGEHMYTIMGQNTEQCSFGDCINNNVV